MSFEQEPKRLRDSESPFAGLVKDFSKASEPEYARQRVWQRVSGELNQPKRRGAWWVALAAGAAVVVAVVALRSGGAQTIDTPVQPPVAVAPASFSVLVASRDATLQGPNGAAMAAVVSAQPVAFEAGSSGSGLLVLQNDDVTVAALQQTKLTVAQGQPLELKSGQLGVASKESFQVKAGAQVFEFKAATAGISFSADGQLTLLVEEGSVSVRTARETLKVMAGQSFPSDADLTPLKAALSALALVKKPTALVKIAAPGPVQVDGIALGEPPIEAQLHVAAHRVESLGVEQTVTPAAEKMTAIQLEAPAQVIEQARQLTTAGNVPAAVEAYSKVAGSSTNSGEVALYERGLLKRRALKDAAAALVDFDAYQRRFPHGALATEVALTRIEVLLELHRDDAALTQMTEFIQGFEGSERLAEVQLMRGQLLRASGNCEAALRDFAAAQRDARWADEAAWGQAMCGQSGEAMREYVKSFPLGAHVTEAKAWLDRE